MHELLGLEYLSMGAKGEHAYICLWQHVCYALHSSLLKDMAGKLRKWAVERVNYS